MGYKHKVVPCCMSNLHGVVCSCDEEASKTKKNLFKLARLQGEYIAMLGKEIDELAPLAAMSGWETTRQKEGEERRRKIAELWEKIG